ncbi:MAG: GNAT family N-acetyltransferase [Bacteroidetes bacterium]|nr:MAG: GNAT family N-acetyltransferase [Bacteroidota bacterium]
MDVKLRAATALDIPKIKELQPKEWGDIIPIVNYYIKSPFCHFIVAEQHGVIMGCGTSIEHGNCAWLATIIVGEEYRGLGLGSIITAYLFDFAKSKVQSILLIATKLGYPIYKKLGFMDDESYTFFEQQPVKPVMPHRNITVYNDVLINQILQLDYEATGEYRPNLIDQRLSEALVYVNNGKLYGFCIPNWGEGLILARTKEAGLALMAVNKRQHPLFALPSSHEVAIAQACDMGHQLIPNRTAIKMYWGKRLDWFPQWQYGRIGGNLG